MLILATETSLASTFAKLRHTFALFHRAGVFSRLTFRCRCQEGWYRAVCYGLSRCRAFWWHHYVVFHRLILSQNKRQCSKFCINHHYHFHFKILAWKSSTSLTEGTLNSVQLRRWVSLKILSLIDHTVQDHWKRWIILDISCHYPNWKELDSVLTL